MARVFLLLWAAPLAAQIIAELRPETARAFEDYVRGVEARVDRQVRTGPFLWADPRRGELREGKILTERRNTGEIPHGQIHDWIGAAFYSGATLDRTLRLIQDYNHHHNVYKPEVVESRLLARDGDFFRIRLRLLKKKIITVVLDTEHDVRYFPLSPTRLHSRSRTTRIVEIDNPGKTSEKPLPEGKDHGFLWRLYTYWRFEEADGGVYAECEAISLTRDVPSALAWLIDPIVRNLPRESLENTLKSTRAALSRR